MYILRKIIVPAILCFLMTVTVIAGEPLSFAKNGKTVKSMPIKNGFFFYEGKNISPPYTINWDKTGISINELPISDKSLNNLYIQQEYEYSDEFSYMDRSKQESLLMWIEQELNSHSMLIICKGGPAKILPSCFAVKVMNILASNDASQDKAGLLMKSQVGSLASWEWMNIIENMNVTETMRAQIKKAEASIPKIPKNYQSENTKYQILAITGLILSVLALGILLSSRPEENIQFKGINKNPKAVKHVWHAIALFIALNLYDLVSTLLIMRNDISMEVNIIAQSMLGTPVLLICFKLAAVGFAALIILKYRHYCLAQLAAWWSCVLYTVILFRWATVLV